MRMNVRLPDFRGKVKRISLKPSAAKMEKQRAAEPRAIGRCTDGGGAQSALPPSVRIRGSGDGALLHFNSDLEEVVVARVAVDERPVGVVEANLTENAVDTLGGFCCGEFR